MWRWSKLMSDVSGHFKASRSGDDHTWESGVKGISLCSASVLCSRGTQLDKLWRGSIAADSSAHIYSFGQSHALAEWT